MKKKDTDRIKGCFVSEGRGIDIKNVDAFASLHDLFPRTLRTIVDLLGDWLSIGDAEEILRQLLFARSAALNEIKNEEEKLVALVSLSGFLQDVILKIPHDFIVRISVPELKHLRGCIDFGEVKLERRPAGMKRGTKSRGYFRKYEQQKAKEFLDHDGAFFSVVVSGWADPFGHGSAIVSAITRIKEVLGLLYCLDLVERGYPSKERRALIRVERTDAELGFANYIFVGSDIGDVLGRTTLGSQDGEQSSARRKALKNSREAIASLMTMRNGIGKRIRAAAAWYLDGISNLNETWAFINVCIGIEALLGDALGKRANHQKRNVRQQLRDRASYLVGRTYEERLRICNLMDELYEKRSDLVHGNLTRLKPSDHQILEESRSLLRLCIEAELRNITFVSAS